MLHATGSDIFHFVVFFIHGMVNNITDVSEITLVICLSMFTPLLTLYKLNLGKISFEPLLVHIEC